MAKVTYVGPSLSLNHSASGHDLFFNQGVPMGVPREVALFYKDQADKHGGPWLVELDPADKVVEAVKGIPDMVSDKAEGAAVVLKKVGRKK